jgi:hypothetical protein
VTGRLLIESKDTTAIWYGMEAHKQSAFLKAAGNRAFGCGDYALAVEKYTEAIRVLNGAPRPEGLHLLHGNRFSAAAAAATSLCSSRLP